MPRKSSWYDSLEPPIRGLVKLLRDNGWNTTCSCGHGMWVELDVTGRMDELEALRVFLLDHGYRNFTITATLRCIDQWSVRHATIHVGGSYTIPADLTSYQELANKVTDLKEQPEKLHQENYRLKKDSAKPLKEINE